jgi:hypothetical protein
VGSVVAASKLLVFHCEKCIEQLPTLRLLQHRLRDPQESETKEKSRRIISASLQVNKRIAFCSSVFSKMCVGKGHPFFSQDGKLLVQVVHSRFNRTFHALEHNAASS